MWHETALAVHNIGEFESPSFHLAVSPAFTMRDDAVTLHYADLQTPMSSRGQRSRSPPLLGRSFDIAALAPDEDQLARAIADAREAGLLSLPRRSGVETPPRPDGDRSFGPRAKAEADKVLTRLLNQVDERRNPRTTATLNQLLDRWLEVLDAEASTRRGYPTKINKHIRPILGQATLHALA